MVLYPNKLPESERVCSGICKYREETFAHFIFFHAKRHKNGY